ncbi:MAG: diguanylate cyclase [Planctomycetes bacterium]|nr:diguanylate cyclase [Planctomycetota bacterium]
MAKLVTLIAGVPREFPLGDQPLTIGREPENEIQLDWPDVSRRHCRIEPLSQGGYRVLDLGSKNGSYLNGRQITAMALEYDDRVRLGEALVVYVDDDTDPYEALKRGSEETFLPFSSKVRQLQANELGDPGVEDETWRKRASEALEGPSTEPRDPAPPPRRASERRPKEHSSAGPHTRASNRSYLKERLVRLGLLSQNIASELDLSRLMETILDEVLDFSGFERGLLLYGEEGRLKPVLGRNMDHMHLEEKQQKFSKGLVEEAIEERRIVFRAGIPADDSSFSARESVVSLGLENALCIPLSAPLRLSSRSVEDAERRRRRRSRVLGAIYLDSTFPIRALDEADLELLEAVAAQAAIALQNARLHYQASTDPLTGLANRGFMKQVFEDELSQARINGEPLGILILDLDHFKRVNDTYGHDVGDEVLKRVAQRIRRTIRRDDHAGRWGGEEFVVCLPGAALKGTLTVARKIIEAIRARPFGQPELEVTVSIGASVYPDHGPGLNTLLKHADQALYAAKHGGRNRVLPFSPELDKTGHRSDPVGSLFDSDPANSHRNLTAIFETINLLRGDQGPQESLERVLDVVCDLTRARRALLVVEDEGELLVTVARARGQGTIAPLSRIDFSRSVVQRAIEEQRSLCMVDVNESQRKLTSTSIDRLGLNTVMVVPLLVSGQPIGVLYADDVVKKREFSQLDLNHLEVIAHQLALSLAANNALSAVAFRHEIDLAETTRLRLEVSRLRAELKRLQDEPPTTP